MILLVSLCKLVNLAVCLSLTKILQVWDDAYFSLVTQQEPLSIKWMNWLNIGQNSIEDGQDMPNIYAIFPTFCYFIEIVTSNLVWNLQYILYKFLIS